MKAVRLPCVVALAFFAWGLGAMAQIPRDMTPVTARTSPEDVAAGKAIYESTCSKCHGIDGGGGDGPILQGVTDRLGDTQTGAIIRQGIPGSGMGAFWQISVEQAGQIFGYLKSLSHEEKGIAPGDIAKGKDTYTKSGCAGCHMIAGEGGDVGPELTRIGAMRGPSYLRGALLNPGSNLPKDAGVMERGRFMQYLFVHTVDKAGKTIDGTRVSEDSFTIVIKDSTGRIHALRKLDLQTFEKIPGKSVMPSYRDTVTGSDLDNLIAYLTSLKGTQ